MLIQEDLHMPKKKYPIELTDKEHSILSKLIKNGSASAKTILRANVILSSDGSISKPLTVSKTAELFHTTPTTVQNIRTIFATAGLDAALYRKKRNTPPVPAKVTGEVEARIIALCCSAPPEGYARWTVRLLADRCVELGFATSLSPMTISRTLKKTNLSLT